MSTKSYFEYVNKKGRKYYYDTVAGTTTFQAPTDGVIFDPTTQQVLWAPPGVKLGGKGKAAKADAEPADANAPTPATDSALLGPIPTVSASPPPQFAQPAAI
jgi:hypothetical protein